MGGGGGGSVGGGGSGVSVGTGSGSEGSGGSVGGGSGVGVSVGGSGVTVLVGVGGIEMTAWAARVGVKVGNGVRVGLTPASSCAPSCGRAEQARVIKTRKPRKTFHL